MNLLVVALSIGVATSTVAADTAVLSPGAAEDVGMSEVEHVSGKPLEAFLRERLYEPLGMDDSYNY